MPQSKKYESGVFQQPLDALDDAQWRVLEMVAWIEFKLGGNAALSHQLSNCTGALAHSMQYGVA